MNQILKTKVGGLGMGMELRDEVHGYQLSARRIGVYEYSDSCKAFEREMEDEMIIRCQRTCEEFETVLPSREPEYYASFLDSWSKRSKLPYEYAVVTPRNMVTGREFDYIIVVVDKLEYCPFITFIQDGMQFVCRVKKALPAIQLRTAQLNKLKGIITVECENDLNTAIVSRKCFYYCYITELKKAKEDDVVVDTIPLKPGKFVVSGPAVISTEL